MEQIEELLNTDQLVAITNYNLILNQFDDNWFLVNDDIVNIDETMEKYLHSFFEEKKVEAALKMLLLDDVLLKTPLKYLSKTERKKFRMIYALLAKKKKIVILDFENGFFEKELNYFKQLFTKLANKYQLKIVICSNEIDFFFGMVNKILLCTPIKNILLTKDIFYQPILYNYLEMPKIVSLINTLNNKGIKMDHHIELKEVLKAIYRDVN